MMSTSGTANNPRPTPSGESPADLADANGLLTLGLSPGVPGPVRCGGGSGSGGGVGKVAAAVRESREIVYISPRFTCQENALGSGYLSWLTA